MKNRTYASKLTKEDLIRGGITLITEDGLVYKGEEEAALSTSSNGYLSFNIYALDEEGNRIKRPITRVFKGRTTPTDTYVYQSKLIGLHRAMWAWFHGEVPEGYVVDHINNKHDDLEDYQLSNLQLLTPAENIIKERDDVNTRQIPCKLSRPLSWYEYRLNKYVALYEEAKRNHRPDLTHKYRTNTSQTRARIRYWLANKEN